MVLGRPLDSQPSVNSKRGMLWRASTGKSDATTLHRRKSAVLQVMHWGTLQRGLDTRMVRLLSRHARREKTASSKGRNQR
eukprot:15482046-Alexandrium_andersonii.AAC.1